MIAVVITARASFAKLETVIEALIQRGLPIRIYLCGSALLERYGRVRLSGLNKHVSAAPTFVECYSHIEGGIPTTSAKSAGALLTELAEHFHRDKPSMVVVMADRSEVLAAAQAASYMNIPLAHIQGGERTGSIDDRCRDAITQLADYHFVSTHFAALRVYGLTGVWERIHETGCPSIDLAKRALLEPPFTRQELSGAGADIDPLGPFAFLLQHSDTTVWETAYQQMQTTLQALYKCQLPVLVQWPNADAGTERISKAIRVWVDRHPDMSIRTVPNYAPTRFLRLLSQASVVVGNSSVGIRECSYLGTPVVNIGDRQQSRERAANVADVGYNEGEIAWAVTRQREHGKYPISLLYGNGTAGEWIAKEIERIYNVS